MFLGDDCIEYKWNCFFLLSSGLRIPSATADPGFWLPGLLEVIEGRGKGAHIHLQRFLVIATHLQAYLVFVHINVSTDSYRALVKQAVSEV